MDMQKFFAAVRKPVFGGNMTPQQVEGTQQIFDGWFQLYPNNDYRQLANFLAQTSWETARRMIPCREGTNASIYADDARARWAAEYVFRNGYTRINYFTPGRFGFVPYGRGRIQVTLDDNYAYVEQKSGIPVTKNPDLLLENEHDIRVSLPGCMEGWWTRGAHTLPRYFNENVQDPMGARRIVNGMNEAQKIANIHYAFVAALEVSMDKESEFVGLLDIELPAPSDAPNAVVANMAWDENASA